MKINNKTKEKRKKKKTNRHGTDNSSSVELYPANFFD